ncbi:dephospho-CoA kinase [Flavobacterium macrobrachii]|jgi:dephospho-CoA kinase|uniref:Dephospho-CoA kinase n=1 Tax=Flavobacterium macrobrachii TaxID=591204 RepID=A0ABS2CUT1_9FLAO|nr:dephospho-CoA kinase [Flavobacterium macrobrachii]MBM6498676.1 dephospho-CoA kinase [Flavobacterium macrobrachii]PZO29088.1 MAG: dephospho-CoA kinase [Flavobacteriaceae bacterium]
MTKIIGLTGGIGSGKTTIAKHFASLGIPVYIADDEAKKLMDNSEIIAKLQAVFGEEIIENKKIDRKALAQIVFQNPKKLKILNSIIHPAVKKHFTDWLSTYKNHPIIIKEAAILFESGSYKDCDSIITVTSPLEERVNRVMKRDNASRESILDRINNQWTDEQRISKSDYVIINISVNEALKQAEEILKKLNNS